MSIIGSDDVFDGRITARIPHESLVCYDKIIYDVHEMNESLIDSLLVAVNSETQSLLQRLLSFACP